MDKSQYQNSNEKSIIDYAICSKTLSKYIMKVLIDDQETYKIKGKNKSDHNTFMIDIEKTINNNKIHPKYLWKINNNTNWNTYKTPIENKIEYNPNQLSRSRTDCVQYSNENQVIPTKYIIIKILKQLDNKSVLPKKNYNKQSKRKIIQK